jgi:hypothetical protein
MNLNDALVLLVADKLELLETMECLHLSRVQAVVTIRKLALSRRNQQSVKNCAVFSVLNTGCPQDWKQNT